MLPNLAIWLIIFGLIFVWLIFLSALFYRLLRHYQKLTKGVSKKDLHSILEKIWRDFGQESKKVNQLTQEIRKIEKDSVYDVQKVGLVRYNPFAETGGDQSFCLAVLDGEDSGVVISSLHGRNTTRIYAKPVKKGKAASFELSSEEKMAVKKAKKVK